MFSETTGAAAACPSHNKYTRLSLTLSLSPRHTPSPRSPPFHLVIPCRHSYTAAATAAARPSGALCRSIENAILLYCTHTQISARARIYIQPLWRRFNRETTTFRPPVEYRGGGGCFCTPNARPATAVTSSSSSDILSATGTWLPVDMYYIHQSRYSHDACSAFCLCVSRRDVMMRYHRYHHNIPISAATTVSNYIYRNIEILSAAVKFY